jgi:hypothetical protein
MAVKLVSHKGKPVISADYHGCLKVEQQFQVLEGISKILDQSNTRLPVLSNYEGVPIGSEYMARVKNSGKQFDSKLGRQALLGITGLKSILVTGYISFTGRSDIKVFASEAEALDWLVE